VAVQGTGAVADPGPLTRADTIAKVDCYNGTTLIGSVTTAPYTVPWTDVPTGKYKITAKATDNQGISKTSTAITVVADTSPDVAIASPLNNTAFEVTGMVTIDANLSDPDGTITKVQFYRGSTLLATVTAPPYRATWSNATKGTFILTAKATDDLGVVTTSMPVTIKVGSNNAPTALVDSDATANMIAPAAVRLRTTASDSDGVISQVEYFNGPALIGRSTTAPFSFDWSQIGAGNYVVTAKAMDNLGASTTSAPLSIVVAPNNLPVVALTSPSNGAQLVGPIDISLTASASDIDGSVAKVEFLDGDTVLATVTSAPYSFVVLGAGPGTYMFSARATDNLGVSNTSAIAEVTVAANGAPIVSVAATPAIATAPATIALTVAASDADGTVTQVEFFNGAQSLGKVSQLPFGMNWTNVAAGSYSIRAVATDSNGATTSSDPIAVTVNTPPTIGITGPQVDRTFASPATVAVTANASAANGASIVSVDFYNNGTLVGTATTAPFGISIPTLPAGSYVMTAVVTDGVGASATSSAVAFTVVDNNAPSLTFTAMPTAPGAPATILLSANASDTDGTITKVEFYSGQVLLGSVTQAPYTYALSDVAAGTYSFLAVATDNLGTSTSSAPVALTISATPVVSMVSPVANAVFAAPAKVMLGATASPANNGSTISQVTFYSSGVLVGSVGNAPYNLEVSNVAAGSYEVTAIATDSLGNSGTSTKLSLRGVTTAAPAVTVQATPTSAQAPATVVLTAAATDSDGTVSKVEFYNGSTLLGSSTQAPYQFNWQSVVAGSYSIAAKAIDNLGTVTTSTPVSVNITGVGSNVYYIHADQINTARLITNEGGATVWQADTDPFGANLPNENPSNLGTFVYNPRFPGQYFDRETGLHYNYFRDYDPSLGRYMQSDPIGLAGGMNTYSYVRGYPIGRSDPFGLWDTKAHNYFIDIVFSNLHPAIRDIIKNGSARADDMEFQDPLHAHMHGMSSGKMTPAEAKKAMCKYIKDHMGQAEDAKNNNDAHYWFYLGMALHPVMDSTSPAHEGFQQWNGVMADGSKHGPWPSSQENISVARQPGHTQRTTDAMRRALAGDLGGCGCD
jgi:RHS repeat-associated protein